MTDTLKIMADDDFDRLVSNVLAVWESATPAERDQGARWYQTAHGIAEQLSERDDVTAAAGVLAALSPQTAWTHNVDIARRAFDQGEPTGHLGDALRKAARIMAGEHPLDVLPAESKTWAFFRCIVDPTDAEAVVIDRHAYDVAEGKRHGQQNRRLTKVRYARYAHAYREAARRLGELPSTVQAVTWVAWRNRTTGTAR